MWRKMEDFFLWTKKNKMKVENEEDEEEKKR